MPPEARLRKLWLIDAGYLFVAQRDVEPGFYFDYKKLRERLEERSGPFWRAYYFNSSRNPHADAASAFHNWLRSAPPSGPKIITRLYQLKTNRADRAYCEECSTPVHLGCPHGQGHHIHSEVQKGVDVGIATTALTLMADYDALVLSSGDGDLLDAIEYISQAGKRIELAVFKSGVSTELQARADAIHWIDDFKDAVRRERSAVGLAT